MNKKDVVELISIVGINRLTIQTNRIYPELSMVDKVVDLMKQLTNPEDLIDLTKGWRKTSFEFEPTGEYGEIVIRLRALHDWKTEGVRMYDSCSIDIWFKLDIKGGGE